jgi:hypothetical protein
MKLPRAKLGFDISKRHLNARKRAPERVGEILPECVRVGGVHGSAV